MAQQAPKPLSRPRTRNDFRIAIFCALPLEAGMVCSIFDENLNDPTPAMGKAPYDTNTYSIGTIASHSVVVVHMAGMGNIDSAVAAGHLRNSFPSIAIVLVVGICGASPTTEEEIVLGDCIVSTSVIQYDFGRQYPDQFSRKTEIEDSLSRTHPSIRTLLAKLQSSPVARYIESRLAQHLVLLQQKDLRTEYPGVFRDQLFRSDYLHAHHKATETCNRCIPNMGVCGKECAELECDKEQLVIRSQLTQLNNHNLPRVHFGRYGSGNAVLKSGQHRDQLSKENTIIAFEMEAAGVWEAFPTLVIKSACDYADSHKNKEWQPYAAATAAAGMKAVLEQLDIVDGISDQIDKYNIPFSLDGVPLARQFIDRPEDMQRLEKTLLPELQHRRKVFVLHGSGGIGKTQLAVEFMRKHDTKFSAIFWLDGNSKDSLKQSIIQQASRIAAKQISESSGGYTGNEAMSAEAIIQQFMKWLNFKDNSRWLIVFDNIDREFVSNGTDPLSYDIKRYFPSADHGSILITTRLVQLGKLGLSQELRKVDNDMAKAILYSWHEADNEDDTSALLEQLDGMPLAIASAGSYLQQTGVGIRTYLRLYKEEEKRLANSVHNLESLLDDYTNRSVWTTWSISFDAVRVKDKYAANLLIVWSFLDRNDFWYGLLEMAYKESSYEFKRRLICDLGDIATHESSFIAAMGLLRAYPLIEGIRQSGKKHHEEGYMMHAVVHRWVYLHNGVTSLLHLGLTSLGIIGNAASFGYQLDAWFETQRRLLSHTNMCLERVIDAKLGDTHLNHYELHFQDNTEMEIALYALEQCSILYFHQHRMDVAERLLWRVVVVAEQAYGTKDIPTLRILRRLSEICLYRGEVGKAKALCQRVLSEFEKQLGTKGMDTLECRRQLGRILTEQGQYDEAEKLLLQVLENQEDTLTVHYSDTLSTRHTLARLYTDQRRFEVVESMYKRSLMVLEKDTGSTQIEVLDVIIRLGGLYCKWRRFGEAEKLLSRALKDSEEVLDPKDLITLSTLTYLGEVFLGQGRVGEAEELLKRSLLGYEESNDTAFLYIHYPFLKTFMLLGDINFNSRPNEARVMYERALAKFSVSESAIIQQHCCRIRERLQELEATQCSGVGTTWQAQEDEGQKENSQLTRKSSKIVSKLLQWKRKRQAALVITLRLY